MPRPCRPASSTCSRSLTFAQLVAGLRPFHAAAAARRAEGWNRIAKFATSGRRVAYRAKQAALARCRALGGRRLSIDSSHCLGLHTFEHDAIRLHLTDGALIEVEAPMHTLMGASRVSRGRLYPGRRVVISSDQPMPTHAA